MENFAECMLEVLDDPTMYRIIVNTRYPELDSNNGDTVELMIDRSNGGNSVKRDSDGKNITDENGNLVFDDPELYDYWLVTDSLGQSKEFNSNIELRRFIDRLQKNGLIKDMHLESF